MPKPKRKPRRMIRFKTTVRAPIATVWEAWTTDLGMRTFHPPGAEIDLRIGGTYQIRRPEPGTESADEGVIDGFLENELLSIDWRTHAKHSRRTLASRVVILLQRKARGATCLKVAHLRLGDGAEWQPVREHLEVAWARLLRAFEARYPPAARSPARPAC